jgi:hypothetical protein
MPRPGATTPLYDIYLVAHNDSVRYALGRSGPRPLLILGLNPSTATQYQRDQTLTRVEHFAKRRATSLIMCNLYPLRATDPDDLPTKADSDLIQQNAIEIYSQIQHTNSPEIWAAWGNPIEQRPYLLDSLIHLHTTLSPLSPIWLRCGSLTKQSHPRHPSRLAYHHRFFPFDIENYLSAQDAISK